MTFKKGDRVQVNTTVVIVNTSGALVRLPRWWEGVVDKTYGGFCHVRSSEYPAVGFRVVLNDMMRLSPMNLVSEESPGDIQEW